MYITWMFQYILKKRKAWAEIFRNIAEVFFASVFINSLFDVNSNLWVSVGGVILAGVFWSASLYLEIE